MTKIQPPSILANTDITNQFNLNVTLFKHSLPPLKVSNLFTHKLIVDLNDIRMHALIQVNADCKKIIFLN